MHLSASGQCLQVEVTDEDFSVARTKQTQAKKSLCGTEHKYKTLSNCIDIDTLVEKSKISCLHHTYL